MKDLAKLFHKNDSGKYEGREYRDMRLNISGDEYAVEGYATTYNEPYHLYFDEYKGKKIEMKESISNHAFDNCDMSDVIMQYDHEGRVFARTSNETLSLDKNDEHGLKVFAWLGGTDIGRQLHQEIKGGYTSKMSFGFIVDRSQDTFDVIEEADDHEVWLRTINSITKLFDVSAVSLPQNNFTEITARNYFDGVIEEFVEAERLKRAEMEERAKAEAERLKAEERKKMLLERLANLRKEEK